MQNASEGACENLGGFPVAAAGCECGGTGGLDRAENMIPPAGERVASPPPPPELLFLDDDVDTPLFQDRVGALSARAAAAQSFRIALELSLRSGEPVVADAADLLGQMVAEMTARIAEPARAAALRAIVLRAIEDRATGYDAAARRDPVAWAARRGGPGVAEKTPPDPAIGASRPEILDPGAAAFADTLRAFAVAAIAETHRRHEAVDSRAIAAQVRAAVLDELAGRARAEA